MQHTVTVKMTDLFNGNEVVRTICASNIMVSDSSAVLDFECQTLASKEKQKALLNAWINDRANEQHNTILELQSWTINAQA